MRSAEEGRYEINTQSIRRREKNIENWNQNISASGIAWISRSSDSPSNSASARYRLIFAFRKPVHCKYRLQLLRMRPWKNRKFEPHNHQCQRVLWRSGVNVLWDIYRSLRDWPVVGIRLIRGINHRHHHSSRGRRQVRRLRLDHNWKRWRIHDQHHPNNRLLLLQGLSLAADQN